MKAITPIESRSATKPGFCHFSRRTWFSQAQDKDKMAPMTSAKRLAACFCLAAAAAFAHHSFAMFDMSKRVTLAGTVSNFEWTNPHCYIEIDVPDEGGAVKHWSIEMGS